jgi:hypothetical protein
VLPLKNTSFPTWKKPWKYELVFDKIWQGNVFFLDASVWKVLRQTHVSTKKHVVASTMRLALKGFTPGILWWMINMNVLSKTRIAVRFLRETSPHDVFWVVTLSQKISQQMRFSNWTMCFRFECLFSGKDSRPKITNTKTSLITKYRDYQLVFAQNFAPWCVSMS